MNDRSQLRVLADNNRANANGVLRAGRSHGGDNAQNCAPRQAHLAGGRQAERQMNGFFTAGSNGIAHGSPYAPATHPAPGSPA